MKRSVALLWLAFFAIFFIPFLWYEPGHLIMGGDITFPLDPALYFESIFQIWRRVYTGTHSAISLTTLPFYAPMALFDLLGFSLITVQKLHFGLWLALPALAMYYLAGIIFSHHPKRLVAQVVTVSVYVFNTYEVVWADSARMAIWVALPLMLGFLIRGLAEKKNWWPQATAIALTSLISSPAAVNPPMFLVFLAVFVFWLFFHFVTTPEDRTRKAVVRIASFILASFTLALVINLYWIIPYANVLASEYKSALTSGLGSINMQDWLDPVSTNTSLLNMFRLQGAWDWYAGWAGEPYVPAAATYQRNIFYLLWSMLVPILAFAALLVKGKAERKFVLFFALLTLLGLLFGAGSHEPTGRLYKWLVEHFPLFSIYRSPWYKFTTWTVLGYSFLVATTLATAIHWLSEQKNRRFLAVGLVSLFLIANTIYASGLVFGKVFPKKHERKRLHSAHVAFPDYFFKAADWINQQPGDFRLLQLPAQQAFNYNWGLGTYMDMSIFTFNKPTIWWPEQTGAGAAKPGAETLAKHAFNELYLGRHNNLGRLLGLLNVKYALQKDDIDYSFYGGQDSPAFIKGQLAKQQLKKAHEVGPWSFHEVPKDDQRPLFYATSGYIETSGPSFVNSILAPAYSPNLTYTDAISDKVPSSAISGRSIVPDITKASYADGLITLPFEIPEAGEYTLTFRPLENVAIFIDGKKAEVSSGDVAKTSLTLAAGEHQLALRPDIAPKNLIQNASFEAGIWQPPDDATKTKAGEPLFSAETATDATDGQRSAKLETRNHDLLIRKGIDDFETSRTYLIGFDYKHLAGEAPRFSIWQDSVHVAEPAESLTPSTSWQRYHTVLQPRSQATGAHLFLYAQDTDNGTPTTILYDNVLAIKLPRLLDTLTFTSLPASDQAMPAVEYTRNSATDYSVTIKGATRPFVLNFLEHFDPGWEVWLDGKTLPQTNHQLAYNYANSWYIDNKTLSALADNSKARSASGRFQDPVDLDKEGSYTLRLRFAPQNRFENAALFSGAGLFVIMVLLLRTRKDKRVKKD